VSVWHIITGEYPPQAGGVSDYTWLVANGLASAGDTVHVWAPECGLPGRRTAAVEVHRLPGHFGLRARTAVGRALRAQPACSVLVQYVPHAYGLRAMNLPFCLWLKSLRHAHLTVMFHEIAFPISASQPFGHSLLGVVTRLMARVACRSAARIMVSSERWQSMLQRLGATAPISWVPVPSTIPAIADPGITARWRESCATKSALLLGHFANYSDYSVAWLSQVIPALFGEQEHLSLLLLGARSEQFRQRLLNVNRNLAGRVHASGPLAVQDLSSALMACDMFMQPYPDGVSTRRSSTSVLLAHGKAVVTTNGIATEQLWRDSGAVAMAPVDNLDRLREVVGQIASNDEIRLRYERAGQALYHRRFALRHTIAALRAG
jgi:glycosyltransferase involved in cell wall biosynthesis